MAELLKGVQLQKKDGSTANAEDVLKDKVVGLYFSAHWCPPCRQFTPVLKDFHDELADSGEFEIVFVSFDRSESDLKKYLEEAHGDWYHIPFGSPKIQELATKYSVSGIPALIIISSDGKEITKNGRSDVQVGVNHLKLLLRRGNPLNSNLCHSA
ncbi:antioxidant, AhpC/TSA family [Teladorsagia circumcincta]|uniref:Antioxidant, AhpC/TSA family n=1 Tax=Teladorsagia circumcincta TaxID=45464 RepID=A0A2G9UQ16_TELCI|nr:antioxidant, AhpC/TSA family [Teladorsagia circumcincta]